MSRFEATVWVLCAACIQFACGGRANTQGVVDDTRSEGGMAQGGGIGSGIGGVTTGGATTSGVTTSGGTTGSVTSGGSGHPSGGAGVGVQGGNAGAGSRTLGTLDLEGTPFYTRAARLTNSQWEHAVTDILRLDAPENLSRDFALPVVGTTTFTNNEKLLYVDSAQAEAYELASEAAANLGTKTDAALAALGAGTERDTFIETFGRRAFRRRLTSEEHEKYGSLFDKGIALYGEGFANGAAIVIRGMLESPEFLYRLELSGTGELLSSYEIASKLSFWLLDTTPSDALLDAAEAGQLDSVEGLEKFAREMLERPAAAAAMRDFHAQLFMYGRISAVSKPGVPEYSDALIVELVQSSSAFFDWIYGENRGIRDVLTSTRGFVGPLTAPLYGLTAKASALELRELGPSRVGYFAQLTPLIINSVGLDPDSIHRGLLINDRVLCSELGPPSNQLPAIPPLRAGQSNRQRITDLTAGCPTCHEFMNPLGFAFENFDGLGRERSVDNGNLVDTSGSYAFIDSVQTFAGAPDLMALIADNKQSHLCYSKNIAGYALQRDIVKEDLPLINTLAGVSRGASLKELVVALVKDPAFRTRQRELP